MSKANSLAAKFGANIAQTVGMRPAGQAPPEAPPTDKYAGAVRARAFAEMPVDAILADPQPRTEFDPEDLARLAESIRRFGQLAPIRVRHDPARDQWVVLVGERRLRACRLAGLERVRVEFVERPMSEADMLAEQVVENAVRSDLLPVEQAKAYKRLMELNDWTGQQVAETLGVDPTAVYRSLALLRLPGDVAERVDAGEIRPTAAYEIAKLHSADEQRELAAAIVSEGLDLKATVAEATRRRSSKGRGAAKARGTSARPRVLRTAAGKVTVEPRRGAGPDAVRAALAEALARVDAELQGRGEAAA